MLIGKLRSRILKGKVSAQPLVDHHGQRVLIAGLADLTANLLRRHVVKRARARLYLDGFRTSSKQRQTKIAEEHLMFGSYEHVFGFEIAVEQTLIVGELQGRGDGARVGDDSLERYSRARRVKLSQVPMWSIVHHQVRGLVLDAKVEDADDMRMHQVAQVARFSKKVFGGMCVHLGVQDFDGYLTIEVDVLAQVDVGKGTFRQPAGQPVVSQTLPCAILRASATSGRNRRVRLAESLRCLLSWVASRRFLFALN